jgi:hypothetical protein
MPYGYVPLLALRADVEPEREHYKRYNRFFRHSQHYSYVLAAASRNL